MLAALAETIAADSTTEQTATMAVVAENTEYVFEEVDVEFPEDDDHVYAAVNEDLSDSDRDSDSDEEVSKLLARVPFNANSNNNSDTHASNVMDTFSSFKNSEVAQASEYKSETAPPGSARSESKYMDMAPQPITPRSQANHFQGADAPLPASAAASAIVKIVKTPVVVVDDFIRNFLITHDMDETLSIFEVRRTTKPHS